MAKAAPRYEAAITRSCGAIFADPAWHRAWRCAGVESIQDSRVLCGRGPRDETVDVPLYRLTESALWRGYEDDADMSGVLDGAVAFLSSVYAISSPLNHLPGPEAGQVVEEALQRAEDWGCQLLLVTNLEPGPVLDHLRTQHPAAEVLLDATCRARLPASEEEFMATVSRSARSDLRRRHRRASEQGVVFAQHRGSEACDRLPEFLALTQQSAAEHGNPPLYDLRTLNAVTSLPGSVLLTAEHEDRILAGSVAFHHGDCLLVWAAGVDYPSLKTLHPYVFLLRETIALAMRLGCRNLDLGRGTFEFKARHGFTPTPLTTLAYPLSAAPATVVSPLREMNRRLTAFLDL